jgi:hypothetical protein
VTAAEGHIRAATRFAAVATAGIAALYLGTLFLCRQGVVADGYDGVGFVLATGKFDLARFAPQPPGYPLFVLLGRGLAALGLAPALALSATSALLLAAGLGALCGVLRVAGGRFFALLFLLLVPTAPIVYGLSMATLSDGAGLGAALLCAVLALRAVYLASSSSSSLSAHVLAGVAAGLALGIRPPLLPLLGLVLGLIYGHAFLRRAIAARAILTTLAAMLLAGLFWLVPFAYFVGAQALVKLTLHHAHGHFADFGGSALVDHAVATRLRELLVGLYQGGLGRLGLSLLPPAIVGCVLNLRRGGRSRRLSELLLILTLGYGVWVFVALPMSAHGRHLLPLAVLLGTLVASGLSRLRHPVARLLFGLALACIAVDNGRAVVAFRSSPPPGARLAAYVVRLLPEDRLYGARAARYLDLSFGPGSARPAVYLGEVLASLERESNLPAEVLVTSEVIASAASQSRLRPLGRFCYAEAVPQVLRFDRSTARTAPGLTRDDCVDLLAYRVRP